MSRRRRYIILLLVLVGSPLITVGGCLFLLFGPSYDRPIRSFDLGRGRTLVILEEGGFQEITQTILYRVEDDNGELASGALDFVGLSVSDEDLDYIALTALGGDIVAVARKSSPNQVWLLWDYRTRGRWSDSSGFRYDCDDADHLLDAMSHLLAEYPDRTFQFAADHVDWRTVSLGDGQP